MNKKTIIYIIFAFIIIGGAYILNDTFTDTIDSDTSMVISVCTGDMRALEVGVSGYCAVNNIPLILSDIHIPDEISTWLPDYIKENNVKKITIVGPIDFSEVIKLKMMGVNVKVVNGRSIPQILTRLTSSYNTTPKSVIITSSDPLAAHLGSYMKVPVFVTASNKSYESSEYLHSSYMNYLKNNNISHVTIVGSLPMTLKDQLHESNITYEEITGSDSVELSYNVNNKIKSLGYLNNSRSVYYGFYGELASAVPLCYANNAMLIEDSSNMGKTNEYLKDNNITDIYFMRNAKSDYIMMEEEDYISSSIIKSLEDDNFKLHFMTNNRTLDEATGLYDVRINSAQKHETNNIHVENLQPQKINTPPLLEILNHTKIRDSNNITANITQQNTTTFKIEYSSIHPYTYTMIDNNTYHITSNGEYEYIYQKNNNTWHVSYIHNNTTYYNTTWIINNNNSITEIQDNTKFTWYKNQDMWICYLNNTPVYTITLK